MDTCIQTFSGKYVDVFNIRPEDICLIDIAHALANTCRFHGHCSTFYSVAEHSVHVAKYLYHTYPATSGNEKIGKEALLHDATEAYIGDMARPIKHSVVMERFRQLETSLHIAIAERFDLSWPMDPAIKIADDLLLGAEMDAFFTSNRESDCTDFQIRDNPVELPYPLIPLCAETRFLAWAERFGVTE